MDETKTEKRRGPRRATRRYLENAAAHYLERFAATTAHFRAVMMRKVAASARAHGTDPEEGARIVEDLIERMTRVGVLDDVRFAEMRTRSLNQRGGSRRLIAARLREKGLDNEAIEGAWQALGIDDEDPEMAAAKRFAERRRLGRHRTGRPKDDQHRLDLAALARAGFSYDVALKVLGPPEDWEGE